MHLRCVSAFGLTDGRLWPYFVDARCPLLPQIKVQVGFRSPPQAGGGIV